MASYVLLLNFTEDGIRTVQKSLDRVKSVDAEAQGLGIKIKERYWTMGDHDQVIVAEAPNDEIMATLVCRMGSRGLVRTQTLRAFSAEEFSRILHNVG